MKKIIASNPSQKKLVVKIERANQLLDEICDLLKKVKAEEKTKKVAAKEKDKAVKKTPLKTSSAKVSSKAAVKSSVKASALPKKTPSVRRKKAAK